MGRVALSLPMLAALRAALTAPASFYPDEATDPDLRGPFLVVTAVAVVGLLGSVPVFQAVTGAVPAGARLFVLIGLVVGAVVGLAAPYVLWLVYALLFYGLSALLGGEGSFRDLFALVGWGFAPNVVSSLVGAAVTAVLISRGDLSDPQQLQELGRTLPTSPLGLLDRGVGLVMTLWSAWVWTHAVAAARELPLRRAAVSVGLVVLAGLALGVASTLLLGP